MLLDLPFHFLHIERNVNQNKGNVNLNEDTMNQNVVKIVIFKLFQGFKAS